MIGDGVPQDLHKAAVWFNKAAHQGDPQAAYYLGLAYANGAGLPQDILQAHAWLNIASKLGDEDATAAGRRLERYMTIEQLKGAAKIAKEISAKLPKKQNDQR